MVWKYSMSFEVMHLFLGLYERILYWVIGKRNFVQESTTLNDDLPSIEHLLITRFLMGFQLYQYDEEALTFLKPILSSMRNNRTSGEISTSVPSNERAGNFHFDFSFNSAQSLEACQRRGADLIQRVGVIFQNIFDTLEILQSIKSINFQRLQRNTLEEITLKINSKFHSTNDKKYVLVGMCIWSTCIINQIFFWLYSQESWVMQMCWIKSLISTSWRLSWYKQRENFDRSKCRDVYFPH